MKQSLGDDSGGRAGEHGGPAHVRSRSRHAIAALWIMVAGVLGTGVPQVGAAAAGGRWAAHFTSISAGANFACGVLKEGSAVCWGDDEGRQAEPQGGAFAQVTAGYHTACGLRRGGRAVCWGDTRGLHPAANKRFASLSSTGWGACGIERTRGRTGPIVCFGAGMSWSPFSSGRFRQVSPGEEAVCGITGSGSIRCASPPGWLPASTLPDGVPHGRFTSLSLGGDYPNSVSIYSGDTACAIRTDRSLACWGDDQWGQAQAPPGPFTQVSVGSEFACGVRVTGAIVCWGNPAVPFVGRPPSGRFVRISAGEADACGLRSGGTAVCWGSNFWGEDDVPAAPFTSVSAAGYSGCAIRADHSLACWGLPGQGVPAGGFKGVSGDEGAYACAIRITGSLVCWPGVYVAGDLGQTAPQGKFTFVSGGGDEACAIRTSGVLVCWGSDPKVKVPAGTFVQVNAGESTACAVRTSGALACWSVYPGISALPASPGLFRQVQVYGGSVCGLEVSGTIECWWPTDVAKGIVVGAAVAPGKYVQMSTQYDICGLTARGRMHCGGRGLCPSSACDSWQWDSGPWSTGIYTAINGSCAIRPNGGLVCWGDWGGLSLELPAASPSAAPPQNLTLEAAARTQPWSGQLMSQHAFSTIPSLAPTTHFLPKAPTTP